MERHWREPLKDPIYKNWDEYIASDRFGRNAKSLHLSLIPTPYLGNIQDAKVLLFIGNPGFGDEDYYFEDQPGIREQLIRNLHQESNGDFPFLFLDPRLAWSGGFRWWQKLLRPLQDVLISRGRSTVGAMEFLSQNIAAVELFPYHSVDGSKLKGVGTKPLMPSVSEAREFLTRISHHREQLTVLLRGHEKWDSSDCADVGSDHHHHGPRQQTISLNPKFQTGEKILAWLER